MSFSKTIDAFPLCVGILGMGTVGTGVARVLLEQPERISARAGRPIRLKKGVVRNLARERGFSFPQGLLSDRPADIIDDPEIQVVMHLVGGIGAAREQLHALLEAGKDVVTANKALLCEYGDELFAKAKKLNRSIAFEAAVAGGIPIITVVNQCMTANQILSISAILNGTSNFILTGMIRDNRSYQSVLEDAQRLGYAEADPTMDVDGTDAAQKLVLLSRLAFGTRVSLNQFPREGIDSLDLADTRFAGELGYTVKLLAVARVHQTESGPRLEVNVSPTLVRHHTPLAEIHGPFNAISLVGDVVGETWYSGRGAGQMPTASAVIADLIDTVTGRSQLTFERFVSGETPTFELLSPSESSSRFYLRFNIEDRPHVLAELADILGRHDISIASVIQHEAPEPERSGTESVPGSLCRELVPLVIMTHRTRWGSLEAAWKELSKLSALRQPMVRLKVAD